MESATLKAKNGKSTSSNMIKGYDELTEKINQTISLIKEVNISSKEQEERIIQINETIASLDTKTQENANIASQTNSAAVKMNNISEEIEEEVSKKIY